MQKPGRGSVLRTVHTVANGLIFSAPFFEGVGDKTYDLIGHTEGNFLSTPQWSSGPNGFAMDFDGVLDRINFPHTEVWEDLPEITLEVIFQIHQLPSEKEDIEYVATKRNTSSPQNVINLRVRENDDKISFSIRNATDLVVTDALDAIVVNRWYHAIGTYDGALIKLYLDGVFQTSAVQTGNIYNADTYFRVGAHSGSAKLLDGKIELINVWNRALSEPEIINRVNDPYEIYRQRKIPVLYRTERGCAGSTSVFSHA